MSGSVYQTGVTQEVVIDRTAPVITLSAPTAGQLVPDATNLTITWTLSDVSAPTSVRIEHSATGGEPWQLLADTAPFTPGSTGSFSWLVPNITGADITTYRVRITAVDRAGAPVGNIAGHTTVKVSDAFTVYDTPPAATGVAGDDPDTTEAGVDGRDFRATWTVSTSTHVSSQRVYILPAAQALNLTVAPVDVPVATFANNTTATWTGTNALATDSRGVALAAGSYRVWIVVVDPAGRTAASSSEAFSVAAP